MDEDIVCDGCNCVECECDELDMYDMLTIVHPMQAGMGFAGITDFTDL